MSIPIYALIWRKNEWFRINPLSQKWSEACAHLKENNVPYGNMKKVAELRLPGSKAPGEKVRSRMNYIWSE